MSINPRTLVAGAVALALAAPMGIVQAQYGQAPEQQRGVQDQTAPQARDGMQQQDQATPQARDGVQQQPPAIGEAPAQPENELMQLTADDLTGRTIVNLQGDALGDIDRVVQGVQDQQIYAVVSVGGFLGIGARDVALPVTEMQLEDDDRILLSTNLTEDDLREQAGEFREEDYLELSGDQQLAAVAGETGVTAEVMSFEELDRNRDGFIYREDAPPQLAQNWEQYDRDGDGRLDRSEFALFEEQMQDQPPAMQPETQQQPGTQPGAQQPGVRQDQPHPSGAQPQ